VNLDAERERFLREILRRLAGVKLSQIQNAIGCSVRYASLIRRGERLPHPMHFKALAALVS